MIRYDQFAQLRQLLDEEHCSAARAAQVMGLDVKTVLAWAGRSTFAPRPAPRRPSLLDPYKDEIVRRLHRHPYSAQQLLGQLREQGYRGGYSIL